MVLTNYETALLVCTMMGPMLEEFPATKNINKMKERIRKQGQNFAKEDKDRFIEIIKLGESVWQKTIQSQKAKTIEPRFFVQNLYTVYEELLVKYIHLNAKMVEKAMTNVFLPIEYESSCNEVTDFIIDELSVYTSVFNKSCSFKELGHTNIDSEVI